MKISKIIAIIAALSIVGVMMTACSKEEQPAEESATVSVSETEDTELVEEIEEEIEETTPAETEEELVDDETTESETEAPETTTEAPETTTEAPETTTEAPETTTKAPETTTAAPETTTEAAKEVDLKSAVDAVTEATEWPVLDEVTDEMMITEYLGLDPNKDSYVQTLFMQCPMSSNLSEILIIKSTDVDSAVEDLKARRTRAIEIHAFYPKDVENAEASIVGKTGDYAYYLLGSSAAEAEDVLVKALKAL